MEVVKNQRLRTYKVSKKFKKEYPNSPVVWAEDFDFLDSYFYVRLDENSKVCKNCLGWIPVYQCADCRKLEPYWFDGIPGTFVL